MPGEVNCATSGCGHPYSEHNVHDGCTAGVYDQHDAWLPCRCRGFRWVDAGGQPVGSYRDAPTSGTRQPST